MPLELQVILASEFIRFDTEELMDFAESKATLQALAHACAKRGLDRALLDLRAVPIPLKPLFTKTELAELVLTFGAAGFSRRQRLAILYREDVHWGIRDFAFISRMRGMLVQAFTDFEAALQWLSEGKESAEEHPAGEVQVSIKRSPSEARKLPVRLTSRRGRGSAKKERCRP